MKAAETVVTALADKQIIVAKNQQDTYNAYAALQGILPWKPLLSRWQFTDEERKAIAEGADLFFTQLTFGNPVQPIQFRIAAELSEEEVREELNIQEFEIRFIRFEDHSESDTVEKAEAQHQKAESESYFPHVQINGLMFTWEQLVNAPELAEARRYIERANGAPIMKEPTKPVQPEVPKVELEAKTDGTETIN